MKPAVSRSLRKYVNPFSSFGLMLASLNQSMTFDPNQPPTPLIPWIMVQAMNRMSTIMKTRKAMLDSISAERVFFSSCNPWFWGGGDWLGVFGGENIGFFVSFHGSFGLISILFGAFQGSLSQEFLDPFS